MLLTLHIRDVAPATLRARIVRLDLAGAPFPFVAGQAVLVGNAGGRRRPYSLAGAPEDAAREGSLELLVGVDASGQPGPHLTLTPGTTVDVEGPLGSFTFPSAPSERRFAFIAGGTGIAPLRAMLRHALAGPHEEIGLFYSARTPEDFAYQDEFRALADAGRMRLQQTITRPHDEMSWSGARGRIDQALLAPLVHAPETLCFICGPQMFVSEMSAALSVLGITEGRIRIERWG